MVQKVEEVRNVIEYSSTGTEILMKVNYYLSTIDFKEYFFTPEEKKIVEDILQDIRQKFS